MVIWFGISIASIVVGVIYKDDCAYQPYVPIYLIVSGVFEALACLIIPLKLFYEKVFYAVEGVLLTFCVCWLITGSIWVFRIPREYQVDCHITVYLFTFAMVIIKIIVIICFIIALIVALYFVLADVRRRNQSEMTT
ncbi:uncharacterized protein LOC143809598 [Ranitomeya variabilis]|uniref:uncharacterized protein LOC143809598 n=1 Tax=Ranitomeya variabilis TaxID=490064 RepID=UPI0040567D23